MNKLKAGDQVIAITGKDKGRTGFIKSFNKAGKCVVEGVNLVTKHQKPNPNKNVEGGLVDIEKPIDVSNIAKYNPEIKKQDKVGIKILEDGTKVRYYKSNGEQID